MCLRSLCFTLAALIATIARADRPNAPATPPPPAPIIFDATLVGDTIVAVGSDGTVLHHRNDQPTWEVVASGTEANLCGVSFADARYGWIVGHGGTILRSADGGLTWQSRGPRRSHHLGFLDVLALAPNHVIVIGGNGVYRETRDGGETWLPREVIEERVHLNRI
ncbi:MAG TPA: YCF48-related protein, partial [Candidatus Synoicihabitans sp.]|nr:YCF48-related protein [Candidatus Synoicihabitans sp.]